LRTRAGQINRSLHPQVESNAMRVFDWLGSYLAHPADCENVLTPSAGLPLIVAT
jgi:hypothetical protein